MTHSVIIFQKRHVVIRVADVILFKTFSFHEKLSVANIYINMSCNKQDCNRSGSLKSESDSISVKYLRSGKKMFHARLKSWFTFIFYRNSCDTLDWTHQNLFSFELCHLFYDSPTYSWMDWFLYAISFSID